MQRATIGEVELAYDVRGAGDPLVLVMGIGSQMVFWDDELVDRFVAQRFQVIRFDHRDIGLSSRLDHLPVPRPGPIVVRSLLSLPVAAPYTLSDMAGDVIGLLDHLGLDRVHVVGVSMGGMIAQHLAIEHPARIRSMTSIMSTPGKVRLAWSDPRALAALFGPRPRTADEAAAQTVETFKKIGGAGDEDLPRLQATAR
ncbi:MAG: alpha/beta fold hydrolase, partial [Kofleriaceae bacterium]|nr:alpha/beta fold hydrolase [Kofleriaceae bacterium]